MFHKLTDEEKEQCLFRIEFHINSKKLFLSKDLSLAQLSAETGITVHKISYLINNGFGLNFNDYINLKRIQYLIENIREPILKDLSVEKMSLVCGFGCRTSCFRAFRKHKGKSLLKYLNDICKI
ncbi:helix-turn-helix domain-containing protein [Flavobacterium sp. LHD-85]|uniref:helix-turn-helix domain-containing protein n=1 Tax=Flavobacterium sp. LHD-85 TaxID=3071410 RepID=UPI0027E0776B|nr:helix-turn-helix domain-containing protein [Flavobacterium sp. LHD-85]MDQ6530997.1 helix-turn-helix domain-containing protein [Flavobacterium sp. LHD-85]